MMHDVIVVGAGPGGASTAHFLARHGLDVLLLDKSSFPRDKTCGDGLTPRALQVLDEMQLLEPVSRAGFRMEEAAVYAPSGASVTTRVPERDDLPSYMLAVPRMILDNLIKERAIASGSTFRDGVRVTGMETLEHGVKVYGVEGTRGVEVYGQMAIVATGASQKLLFDLGILRERPNMILAARVYFQEIGQLKSRFEFHFDGVPLPGYGWIFPVSETSANIGAGIMPAAARGGSNARNAKRMLEGFLRLPLMRELLAGASQWGPVKGYPLRTDFATTRTYAERLLLVGEAAGLVNPLTGEGVDLALESGRLAASHLIGMFSAGDFSLAQLSRYDQRLRERFQRLFLFSQRIRRWYLNRPVLNRLVDVADRREGLRSLFTDIVLGNVDASKGLSLGTLRQIVFGR